jgi:hypothetical protein
MEFIGEGGDVNSSKVIESIHDWAGAERELGAIIVRCVKSLLKRPI